MCGPGLRAEDRMVVKTSLALGSLTGTARWVELVEKQCAEGGVKGTQGAAPTAPGHCAGCHLLFTAPFEMCRGTM